MKLPRRRFLHLAAGAVALPTLSRVASAQAYPSRLAVKAIGFLARVFWSTPEASSSVGSSGGVFTPLKVPILSEP
jgi:hypothetical protein